MPSVPEAWWQISGKMFAFTYHFLVCISQSLTTTYHCAVPEIMSSLGTAALFGKTTQKFELMTGVYASQQLISLINFLTYSYHNCGCLLADAQLRHLTSTSQKPETRSSKINKFAAIGTIFLSLCKSGSKKLEARD